MTALRTQLEAQVLGTTNPVTVVINGTPNQNQIRNALENVLKVLNQSSEYSRG